MEHGSNETAVLRTQISFLKLKSNHCERFGDFGSSLVPVLLTGTGNTYKTTAILQTIGVQQILFVYSQDYLVY
jgi:hypothetical protein